jgi:hypothetical protein
MAKKPTYPPTHTLFSEQPIFKSPLVADCELRFIKLNAAVSNLLK